MGLPNYYFDACLCYYFLNYHGEVTQITLILFEPFKMFNKVS